MKAEFIARKSVFGDCGGRLFLCFLFCWLIVPIYRHMADHAGIELQAVFLSG